MKALLKLKIRLMKDNRTLYIIMIAMSLIFAGLFGNSMGGSYVATIAVIDEDQSVEASNLITKLTSEYNFKVNLVSYNEGIDQVMNRDAISLVHLKKAFYDSATGVEIVQIRETVESAQLSRILESEIALINNTNYLIDQTAQIIEKVTPSLDKQALSSTIKTTFLTHWEDKRPIATTLTESDSTIPLSAGLNIHFVVGMTLFFVTYSLMFTVGDMLEDKRLHTLDRMLVSPSTRMDMLAANLISAMIIGTIQIIVMVTSGQFLFGIEWGNNLLLVIGIGILYIFVITAMSLFVVSLMKTMAQLGAISPIVLTGMAMLGGCMWPLEIITSKPLLMLANITPHKWAIAAIKNAVVYGKIDQDTILSVSVLLVMGIFYLILGERVLYFKSLKDN